MPHVKANSVPYLEPEDFDKDLFIDEINKFLEVWDKADDGYHLMEKREQAWRIIMAKFKFEDGE